MHPNSIARIPQVLITLRHLPFHESFTHLLGLVAGAAERLQQPAKFCSKISSLQLKTALKPALYNTPPVSHLHSRFFSLDPHNHQLTTSFRPVATFLPPPLINTAPCLAIICAAFFLHSITPPQKEQPPHAFIYNSNGEIPVAKMAANKIESNPQQHVVFTPVR